MFRISRQRPWPPVVDLHTVRDTLSYMKDDMDRVPGLEKVAAALQGAIDEIEKARPPSPIPFSPATARFLPRRT